MHSKSSFLYLTTLSLLLGLGACTSKKEMLYFQDAKQYNDTRSIVSLSTIQRNDILSIDVQALVPESALIYNLQIGQANNVQAMNVEILRLKGYVVDDEGNIKFPVLGSVKVAGLTLKQLELRLETLLDKGGHLVAPNVSARLLNAKVTVLGEVKKPGTYAFTEPFITLPQALGYAGGLTINAERKNLLLVRDIDGIRQTHLVDLTTANWLNDPVYSIRQNDIIVVNPNVAKVKSAGLVGNSGTVLTIASLILSSLVLLTR
jgi:polysaccharide export outer membrane protein